MGNVCKGEGTENAAQADLVDVNNETSGQTEEKLNESMSPVVDEPAKPVPGPTVKVVMARGLRNADWSWIPGKGVSDAYVVVSVGGKEIARTGVIANTLEPIFNQELDLVGDFGAMPEKIDFEVWDKDNTTDDKLGHCSLSKEKYAKGFNDEIAIEDAGKGIKAFLKVMVKLPNGDYPAGPSNQFKITLKKEKGGPIGFEVDDTDNTMLFICDGKFEGAAKEHNDKAEPSLQLKKAQYIVGVNGVEGDTKKMKAEIKSKDEVTLTVRRPMFFTIAVDKKGPFGVVLTNAPTAAYVNKMVTGKTTCISQWNAAHKDKQVKVSDRFVCVNGKQGFGKDITEMLKSDGTKQVVVCRPSDTTVLETMCNYLA